MAPKKVKKTKEELEEERRVAEEAARLAEEERLRLEEEERQRLAELERQRQELLASLMAAEGERCDAERQEVEQLKGQYALERAQAKEQRRLDREWERYLSCTSVPHPKDRIAVSDFLAMMGSGSDKTMSEALSSCQDCYHLIDECTFFLYEAHLFNDSSAKEQCSTDITELHRLVGLRNDRLSAHLLHFADEHANDRGEIQVGLHQGFFQIGLWVNTSKNPRMKTIEMPQLNLIIDIPKQIALASVSIRVEHHLRDEYFNLCTNEFMAVGGVLHVDLLTLPPPAKKVNQWVLRQVTPLAFNVTRIPYPIPPAGADPATYRSEEEPPPLGFTFPYTPNIILLDEPIKVAWWNAESSCWSTDGVDRASVDAETGQLYFESTHLGPLAVVQARTRVLPYRSWSIRPTGGRGGSTATMTIDIGLSEPLMINAGPGWVQLSGAAEKTLPQLQGLSSRKLQPVELLLELSRHGLHLLPEDRDGQFANVVLKQREVEESMCEEVALLCGSFLISRAKWNQSAGSEDCIVRISEVLDWEEGGRTDQSHLDRIFSKEKEDGERRVLTVMRRGARGFAFCDALDRRYGPQDIIGKGEHKIDPLSFVLLNDVWENLSRSEMPQLPGHETAESVQACMDSVWGEVHASLLTLLKGPSLSNAELETGPLLQRLRASPEGLELVHNTNPLLTQMIGQTLFLLRVFSFA